MIRKIAMASIALIFSMSVYSSTEYDTKIETFLDQRGVAIYSKLKPVGEYLSADEKPIKFTTINSNQVGSLEGADGVQVSIHRSKHSDIALGSYIDKDELPGLISNLRKIWNHTSSISEGEYSTLTLQTRSGVSFILFELSEDQTKEIDVKRFMFVATAEAADEFEKLTDPSKFDDIDGLAILPMEGLKDIISILEKAS